MVCLLAVPWVQLSVSAGNGWPHNALGHHWLMPVSCHFRDCKALLVTTLTHVSGAITSAQTFTLPLPFILFTVTFITPLKQPWTNAFEYRSEAHAVHACRVSWPHLRQLQRDSAYSAEQLKHTYANTCRNTHIHWLEIQTWDMSLDSDMRHVCRFRHETRI